MANDAILDNRKGKRQRQDVTALHFATVDGTVTQKDVRLDVVSRKISVQVPSTVTVTVQRSLNGSDFTQIAAGVSGAYATYGGADAEDLTKVIRIIRTAGAGSVTVAGV
jgi:hypothetical protein